ncbi:uncharacterized protein [Physcomitrium patens]|uniref:uncharacterized protein isoform X2 n=1 Tax=Physcomitrium patens TaxID=3218 RepID=UPI000D169497|nr:uncharacterized protein LOC112285517 isoform X2 [Physcomitrium patens]|eukprot:XP_024382194.1 uncharacterized protein LOC112285517 isoform X2 [Physcomitrella patens]
MALCCVLVAASPPLLRASWSSLRPTALRPALPSAAWCRSAGRCPGSRVGKGHKGIRHGVVVSFLPVDPWAPNTDQQSIASSLFAASLFPYLGFLYHITKSKTAPKLTLFGFYFLLAFVGATIPAGIYGNLQPRMRNLMSKFLVQQPRCTMERLCPTWIGCTEVLSPC